MTFEEDKEVTPLDLLNSKNYTSKDIRNKRLDVCHSCSEFNKITRTCSQCGCFMAMKTWLHNAQCPQNKW